MKSNCDYSKGEEQEQRQQQQQQQNSNSFNRNEGKSQRRQASTHSASQRGSPPQPQPLRIQDHRLEPHGPDADHGNGDFDMQRQDNGSSDGPMTGIDVGQQAATTKMVMEFDVPIQQASPRHNRHSLSHPHQQPQIGLAVITRPGAIAVGARGDQSVSIYESVSSLASNVEPDGMRAPSGPFPAYTVFERNDMVNEQKEERRNQIQALHDELQQIGDAVNDIDGTLNGVVQGAIAEEISTQPQQSIENQQRRKQRCRASASVGVFLLCIGLAILLTVLNLATTTPPKDRCFTDRAELLQAIDSFLQGDDIGPNSTLTQRYGWPMNAWSVGKVQNFNGLFNSLRNPTARNFNENISSWDVSRVTSMINTFRNSSFDGDLSTWNVSKVKDFEGMFSASDFNGNVSGWDVSGATDMSSMFDNSTSFNRDLSSWVVSNVVKMQFMFSRAASFDGDVSTWNVSNVASMAGLFRGTQCSGNLSCWDVSKVKTFDIMFLDSDFNGDISSWNVSGATIMTSMFERTTSFNQPLSRWDVTRITDARWMFLEAAKFNGDVSSWNVSKLTNARMMFYGAAAFDGDLSGWDVSSVTDTSYMFSGALSFNGNISTWNVSRVTNMDRMFFGADAFNQDLSLWDVAGVSVFRKQFSGANSFRQDLCSWGLHMQDDADVTDMFVDTSCESYADPVAIGAFANASGSLCYFCDAS